MRAVVGRGALSGVNSGPADESCLGHVALVAVWHLAAHPVVPSLNLLFVLWVLALLSTFPPFELRLQPSWCVVGIA
jgi:hypothetical protein